MSKKTVRESTSAIRKCLLKSCFDLGPLVSDEVKSVLTMSYSTICEELHNIESYEGLTTKEEPVLPPVLSASHDPETPIRYLPDVRVIVNGIVNKIPLRNNMIHYDDVVAKTPIPVKKKPLVRWRNIVKGDSGFLYPRSFIYCNGLTKSNLLIHPPTFNSDIVFHVFEDVEGVNDLENGMLFDEYLVEVEINEVKALVRHQGGFVSYKEIVRLSGVKEPLPVVTYTTRDGCPQEMSSLSSVVVCTNLVPAPNRPDIYVSNNNARFFVVPAVKA